MKKIIIPALLASALFATTYTLNPGWNLLGTQHSIAVSKILANSQVRNVTIYQNGGYLSSSENQFTTIPSNSGFFVYTDSSTSITITDTTLSSSTFQHLDGNLNPTSASSWAILKVVDANLLVEMKTSVYNAGSLYTHAEAISYCQGLTVGSTTDWRVPTFSEMSGLSAIYKDGNSNEFIIESGDSMYWTDRLPHFNANLNYYYYYYYTFNGSSDYIYGAARTICVKTAP